MIRGLLTGFNPKFRFIVGKLGSGLALLHFIYLAITCISEKVHNTIANLAFFGGLPASTLIAVVISMRLMTQTTRCAHP